MTAPIAWEWTGSSMRPLRRFERQAAREFEPGKRYVMEAVDEVQSARDRAYHAQIRDAWSNLPEILAQEFRNPNDFRKYLLVKCQFCTVTRLAFASARAAMDAVPLLSTDGAVVTLKGAVAVVAKPASQKLRGGLSKEDRLRSYRETLDLAASMIGVSSDDLQREAGQAA